MAAQPPQQVAQRGGDVLAHDSTDCFVHATSRLVAVVGLADARLAEVPVAYVVPQPGTRPDPECLKAFCRDHLANYKVPREIKILEELPRSSTGKIVRRELQGLLRSAD